MGSPSVVGRPVPSQPLLPDHLKRVVTQIQVTTHRFPSNVRGKENSSEEGTALKVGTYFSYFSLFSNEGLFPNLCITLFFT